MKALAAALVSTLRDLTPIIAVIFFFQRVVLRRSLTNVVQVAVGLGAVLVGLWMLLVGLQLSLFPLGESLAQQWMRGPGASPAAWYHPLGIYLLAFALAFSSTVAEPALLAVALKAEEVSGGTIRAGPLRVAVAVGAGLGVLLGAVRVVNGLPLVYFVLVGYVLVIVQTVRAPASIVPLAYDAGGVTTSTITVPLVTALGVGLAEQLDQPALQAGFGMIALAVLFPMVTVMGYAQLAHWWAGRRRAAAPHTPHQVPPGEHADALQTDHRVRG